MPVNNENYREILKVLKKIIKETGEGLKLHDLRMIRNGKELQFDVVVPEKFNFSDEELERVLRVQIEERIGNYDLDITFDHNYLLY